jgi:ABC-type molybdate transport system permease subunit
MDMSQWLLHRQAVAASLIRIVLYVAIVLSPVVVVTALRPLPEMGSIYTLGLATSPCRPSQE